MVLSINEIRRIKAAFQAEYPGVAVGIGWSAEAKEYTLDVNIYPGQKYDFPDKYRGVSICVTQIQVAEPYDE